MPPSQTVDKLVLGFVSQSQFSFINQIAFKIKFVKWAAPHRFHPGQLFQIHAGKCKPDFHFHSGFSKHLCISKP